MTQSGEHEAGTTEFRKKYQVIAGLGQGGMALVHLAVVRGVAGVRKLVVLKSIRPDLSVSRQMREMFLTEARLSAMFRHPNIVESYEVAVIRGRPMLVMEYLEGQPLARIVSEERREQVPLALQLFVLKEVLSGLDHVHTLTDLDGTPLNLVHRDVSPQNVFVTYDGRVKLLDFGIAKKMGSSDTETGVVKGKVRYMPPEQVVGSALIDRRADLFSVGVMLWEALTGQRMWESNSDLQIMQALTNGNIPSPSSVAPGVPPALEAVCLRALAPNADDRYVSAPAMQADLERAIKELGRETGHRELGKHVAHWFAEARTATRDAIEAQLKDPNAAMVNLMFDDVGLPTQNSTVATAGLWNVPSTPSLSTSPETGKSGRSHLRWTAAGLVGLAIALAIASALSLRQVRGSAEAPSSSAATAAGQPDAKLVRVAIEATPAGARLYLDDGPLPNPFVGELARDAAEHRVRAEAPGYQPQTLGVTLTDELKLKVELELSPAPQGPRSDGSKMTHVAAGAKGGAAAGVKARAQPAVSCNPPYYFVDGIKHLKPECLK